MLLLLYTHAEMALPMELVWLEDFTALAEHGSFVKAAQARHITQPAFSRRIKAFEQWMGTRLFIRTPQGTTLTPAGRHIQAGAFESISRLYSLRTEAQEVAGKADRTLKFAATHSLSFTFFPRWVRQTESGRAPIEAVHLHSDTMLACEHILRTGAAHFLLSHRDPLVPSLLPPEQFQSIFIGKDKLIPLASSELAKEHVRGALPYLAYAEASGLGRIVSHRLKKDGDLLLMLEPRFSSHLAAVLMSMALESKGVAWLPESLTEHEVSDGRLVRALNEEWDIPLQVELTRPRILSSTFADSFWQKLARI